MQKCYHIVMAQTYSFDIESDFNASEMDHALDQARREISQRYDFRGTAAAIDYSSEARNGVTISGDNDYHLEAILDLFRKKLAKRDLSQAILDTSKTPEKSGATISQDVPFQKGLDQPKAKDLNKKIREIAPKAKPQIQGETIRVTAQSKDDLQAIIQKLKSLELPYPLTFTNFR